LKRSEKIFAFCKKYVKVPDGALVGKPIELLQFQKKFIAAVYDNPHGTRKAIMSISRKNGKTVTMALLILVHLVGPEAKQNTQIASGAMSRDQAALVFDLACKIIMQSPELSKIIRIIPSKKMLVGLPMNVTYEALAADGKTAQGRSIIFGIIYDAGQIVGAIRGAIRGDRRRRFIPKRSPTESKRERRSRAFRPFAT
jgi:phage terminase large subunit-like protein